jgi:anti-sigma regulatory factor (Ser/Thr protein kinase)
MNLADPGTALRHWRLPVDGIGLARMEFIITDDVRVHPMALCRFEQVTDPAARREIEAAAFVLRAKAEEKGLDFEVAIAACVQGNFLGDPLRLRQIVSNLTFNAVKFTERGGVRINVASSDDQRIVIRVEDTGAGFDEAFSKWIFRRFEQADSSVTRVHGGTGLGLAITKSLVDLMGGENRRPPFNSTVNVSGQLPALELDNGQTISEITAICEYLEEVGEGPALIGSTPEARAETRMWVRRIDQNIAWPMGEGFSTEEGRAFFEGDKAYGDNDLPLVPPHLYRAELRYDHPAGWFVAPSVEWTPSDSWVDYMNTLKAPGYTVVNLGLGYRLDQRASLFVDARNLLDERYVSNFSAVTDARTGSTAVFWPGEGISAFVGLRFAL